MQLIYLTAGRDRSFQLGALTVKLRDAPPWLMLPSHPAAGEAVRALDWIDEPGAPRALAKLKRTLPSSTLDDLVALRPVLPDWMSRAITEALVTPN